MSAVHCSPVLITLRKSSASFTLACLALPGTWGLTDLSLDAAGQTPDTQTLSWIPHAWAQFPVRLPWICFLIAVSLFLDGLSGSSSGCHLCVCVCVWMNRCPCPSQSDLSFCLQYFGSDVYHFTTKSPASQQLARAWRWLQILLAVAPLGFCLSLPSAQNFSQTLPSKTKLPRVAKW